MQTLAAERLASFLARAAMTPFDWGTWDCSLWLADWLVENGYADPAGHLRGRYDTALSCARLLRAEGGLMAVVSDCAMRAALARTYSPGAGAVGVVEAMTNDGRALVGALCTGPRWAVLTHGGIMVWPAAPIIAWEV
ncbi:MAG: hypothetical protein V4466_11620 [Pseudomonadota bacterium]